MVLKHFSKFNNYFINLFNKVSQRDPKNLWDAINDYILKEYKDRVEVVTSHSSFSVYYTIKTGNTGKGSFIIRVSDHIMSPERDVKDINIIIPKNGKQKYIVSYKLSSPFIYSYNEVVNFIEHYFYIADTENYQPMPLNSSFVIKDVVNPSTNINFVGKVDYSKMPLFGDWGDWTYEAHTAKGKWKEFIAWYKEHIFNIEWEGWPDEAKSYFKMCFDYPNMSFDEVQQHIAMSFAAYPFDHVAASRAANKEIQVASEGKKNAEKEAKRQAEKEARKLAEIEGVFKDENIDELQISNKLKKDFKFFTGYVELSGEYNNYLYRGSHILDTLNEFSKMFPWLTDDTFTEDVKKRLRGLMHTIFGCKLGGTCKDLVTCMLYEYFLKCKQGNETGIISIMTGVATRAKLGNGKTKEAKKVFDMYMENIKNDSITEKIEKLKEPVKETIEHPEQYECTYDTPKVEEVQVDDWIDSIDNRRNDNQKLELYLYKDINFYQTMTKNQKNIIKEFCLNDIPYKDCVEVINSSYNLQHCTTKSLQQGIYQYLHKDDKKEEAV